MKSEFDAGQGEFSARFRLLAKFKDYDGDNSRHVTCGSAVYRLMGRDLAETEATCEGVDERPT